MSLTPLDLLRHQTYSDDCPGVPDDLRGDEDEYLQGLLDAAEEWVALHTHRPIEELCDGTGLRPPVRHAVLMLAAHWYNQREAAVSGTQSPPPYGVETLLSPFRRLSRNAP